MFTMSTNLAECDSCQHQLTGTECKVLLRLRGNLVLANFKCNISTMCDVLA